MLVTILAFAYIPLILVTSVFGKLVQQLNGSGKPLAAFLATAIVAAILTGASWFLVTEVKNVQDWRQHPIDGREKRRELPYPTPPPRKVAISTPMRLVLLLWLIVNGCSMWMILSRAAWCILTNSEQPFRPKQQSHAQSFRKPAADYLNEAISLWKGSDEWTLNVYKK